MESWLVIELHRRIIPLFNRNRSRNSVLSMVWADMAKMKIEHFGALPLALRVSVTAGRPAGHTHGARYSKWQPKGCNKEIGG